MYLRTYCILPEGHQVQGARRIEGVNVHFTFTEWTASCLFRLGCITYSFADPKQIHTVRTYQGLLTSLGFICNGELTCTKCKLHHPMRHVTVCTISHLVHEQFNALRAPVVCGPVERQTALVILQTSEEKAIRYIHT